MNKNLKKFDAAVVSIGETKEILQGLGGLFQNATGDLGMATNELQGIGTLMHVLSKRLGKAAGTVELTAKIRGLHKKAELEVGQK
jgi:hypothetical protein